MSFTSRGKEKVIDDSLCFVLWTELGSIAKVEMHMAERGYVNPRTGRPFSRSGIHQSAYRYMIENPNKAREVLVENGDQRTQEEWEIDLVRATANMYGRMSSRSRFLRWLRKNDFVEKYKFVWKKYVYLDDLLLKEGE